MKNILAENMLRFGVKNLSDRSKRKLTNQSKLDEQEQVAGAQPAAAGVSNINISLEKALLDKAVAQGGPILLSIPAEDGEIVTFPAGSDGGAVTGDLAIKNKDGIITHIGGGQYAITGNIGKLAISTNGASINGATAQTIIIQTTPIDMSARMAANNTTATKGNPVRLIAGPYKATSNLSWILATLVNKTVDNAKNLDIKVSGKYILSHLMGAKTYGVPIEQAAATNFYTLAQDTLKKI